MVYELATLSCPLLALDAAARRVLGWMDAPEARGETLGCWRTDIGELGRVIALRGFATADDRAMERERVLMSDAPFGARPDIDRLVVANHRRLPILPAFAPGRRGAVYEFRTYHLRPGGLAPTIAGWTRALDAARDYAPHLVTNLYAEDGDLRITHIWAFDSLAQRTALRTAAYAAGTWPPPGGPEQILRATSTIALPVEGSPLR